MFGKKQEQTQEDKEWAFKGLNFRVFRLHESSWSRLDEELSKGWKIVGIDGNNWVQGIYLVRDDKQQKKPEVEHE